MKGLILFASRVSQDGLVLGDNDSSHWVELGGAVITPGVALYGGHVSAEWNTHGLQIPFGSLGKLRRKDGSGGTTVAANGARDFVKELRFHLDHRRKDVRFIFDKIADEIRIHSLEPHERKR